MTPDSSRCGSNGGPCSPCAPCKRCSTTGTCELDPAADWGITCVSAEVMPRTASGMVWDPPNGDPDPFCELVVNNTVVGRTMTINNNLSPDWDQSITAGGTYPLSLFLAPNPIWHISVLDDDPPNATQNICTVMSLAETDFEAGQALFSNVGRCTTLELRLTCPP
jgi:hypothetical protein